MKQPWFVTPNDDRLSDESQEVAVRLSALAPRGHYLDLRVYVIVCDVFGEACR